VINTLCKIIIIITPILSFIHNIYYPNSLTYSRIYYPNTLIDSYHVLPPYTQKINNTCISYREHNNFERIDVPVRSSHISSQCHSGLLANKFFQLLPRWRRLFGLFCQDDLHRATGYRLDTNFICCACKSFSEAYIFSVTVSLQLLCQAEAARLSTCSIHATGCLITHTILTFVTMTVCSINITVKVCTLECSSLRCKHSRNYLHRKLVCHKYTYEFQLY